MFDFTTIERGSHYVAVRKPTPAIVKALYKLATEYTQFDFVVEKGRRIWKPVTTYAVYAHGGAEYRLHINQLERLLDLMQQQNVTPGSYEIVDRPIYEPEDININIKEEFVLRPQQEDACTFIDGSGSSPLLMMPMGTGKDQPLDAKIKIPGGWTTMGEVKQGDLVTAWDGTPSKVLGVYPQGQRQVYELTFEDGRKTECGSEHLWTVLDARKGGNAETIPLRRVMQLLTEKELFIHLPMPEKVEDVAKSDYRISYDLLSDEGIMNLANGSPSQKLYVLKYLMTMYGRVDKVRKKISFVSSYQQLVASVVEAVRGLGGMAKVENNGNQSVVEITYHSPRNLFIPSMRSTDFGDFDSMECERIKLVSVRSTRVTETQCIAIDHPDHLYVTDDYIVTHNTITSLVATARRKKRFAVMILASYLDKWLGDIQKCTDINESEICVVKGSDGLERSTLYPSSNLPMPKAFVVSINSFGRWMKNYEAVANNSVLEGFACTPDRYFEHLGVGSVIFDEVHQHPHAVFKIFTYTHVPKTIALTATMFAKDPIIRKVQSTMFPKQKRFEEIKMAQYIDVVACNYQIMDLGRTKIRTTEYGSNSYSQTAYEKSIISDRVIYPQYMKMCMDLIEESYISKRQTGDKLIFFVGSKDMATRMMQMAKKLWPNLDIRTYLQGDGYENVIVPDIRFTTVIGGGTAIDIPQLTVAIMSNNLDSPNANLQAFGRLREIKNKETSFYYLYCSTLAKHRDYHESRKKLFATRAKSQGERILPPLLGQAPAYQKFNTPIRHG